jgi:5-methyltetrahydrofolate--homocysteine methyltransferase
MRELGEKFQRMEIFLVDLMLAADAMKAGVSVLNRRLSELSEKPVKAGTFVIGTVKGDLHDIGKNIVATMLSVAGFEVIDLGVDVSNSTFAEAVERYRPDILGLSALMTTTRPMQKDVIEYLKALELRDKCKILVGGGSVTKEYAEEIGADGYAPDAASAVEVAKKLVAGGVKEV